MNAALEWIRPWFPAGWEGHVAADCPDLLKRVSEPVEGAGWLDVKQGVICVTCVPSWNAECATCSASLDADENLDGPFTEADAKAWLGDHQCSPIVRIIPPAEPEPEAVPAGQVLLPLFEESTS